MSDKSVRESRAKTDSGEHDSYAWYALFVLLLIYVCNFIDRQILSILAEDIKRDLQISDQQIGVLYGTVFAVFFSLFGIPLGRLADGWRSEEHTSELQSLMRISYAVFCLKKQKKTIYSAN